MSRIRNEEGAVAVLTAVLAVVLFGLAALVVDLGVARDNRRQAQNTADAAALAAANALYGSTPDDLNAPGDLEAAIAAAKEYAAANYGTTAPEWAACTNPEALAVKADTSCISFDKSPYPSNVLVQVPLRQQPTLFGGVVGYSGVSISAIAQARIAPGSGQICTFCVLKPIEHDLGNGDLSVTGGNIWMNGDIDIGPNGSATSNVGSLVGEDGSVYDDGGNAYVSGVIKNGTKFQNGQGKGGQPVVVDPLAATELPFALQEFLDPQDDPCTDGPGIYDSYTQSNTVCTMEPGLYVFTGDVKMAGNSSSSLVAEGVTMYFTCGSGTDPQPCVPGGDPGGGIDLSGNGNVTIAAPLKSTHPDVDPELYGFSIVYDRYNTALMQMTGNGSGSIDGTVYAVNATLDFRGNGGSLATSSMFVIGDITFSGNGAGLTVNYDAGKNKKPSDAGRGLVR